MGSNRFDQLPISDLKQQVNQCEVLLKIKEDFVRKLKKKLEEQETALAQVKGNLARPRGTAIGAIRALGKTRKHRVCFKVNTGLRSNSVSVLMKEYWAHP